MLRGEKSFASPARRRLIPEKWVQIIGFPCHVVFVERIQHSTREIRSIHYYSMSQLLYGSSGQGWKALRSYALLKAGEFWDMLRVASDFFHVLLETAASVEISRLFVEGIDSSQ